MPSGVCDGCNSVVFLCPIVNSCTWAAVVEIIILGFLICCVLMAALTAVWIIAYRKSRTRRAAAQEAGFTATAGVQAVPSVRDAGVEMSEEQDESPPRGGKAALRSASPLDLTTVVLELCKGPQPPPAECRVSGADVVGMHCDAGPPGATTGTQNPPMDLLAVPTGRRQGGRMRLVAEDPRDPSGPAVLLRTHPSLAPPGTLPRNPALHPNPADTSAAGLDTSLDDYEELLVGLLVTLGR